MRTDWRLFTRALGAATVLASCTEQVPFAVSANEYVVQAVLDAGERTQFVLVEHTTGAPNTQTAVRNAVVTLTAPNGRVYAAQPVLDSVRGYFAPGKTPVVTYVRLIYLIDLNIYDDSLLAGGKYTLQVRIGSVNITGETIIPGGPGVTAALAPIDTFFRSRDTLALAWPAASGARSHQVVLSESGVARYTIFADQGLALPGTATMHDGATDSQVPVFVPNIRYDVSVLAVDANYYNYFSNESGVQQSSAGVPGALRGAIGVFGSIARVSQRSILVK